MARWRMVALFAVALGCGADGPVSDAAPDDAVADMGEPEPEIPWLAEGAPPVSLPSLSPCPGGWREVATSDVTTCEPYPEGGPSACAPGEAHFPGGPGCEPVGAPCPVGTFAEGLPETGVVYVLEGATGGDGSEGAPLGSLADVDWAGLTSGGVVALGRGTYEGVVALNAGVALVGACAAETVLTGPPPPVAAAVVMRTRGDAARISNVTIDGSRVTGIGLAGSRQRLIAKGVIIEGATSAAIRVTMGAAFEARQLVVRGTRPDATGQFGFGVQVFPGTVQIERAVFEGNHTAGIIATLAGSALTLTDIAVRDTRPQPSDSEAGRSIVAQVGARVDVSRAILTESRGVLVAGEDAVMTLEDVVIREIRPRASNGLLGRAIDVALAGRLEARRLLLEDAREAAVVVAPAPSHAALEDVVIRDTLGREIDGEKGIAVLLQQGGSANISRLLIERYQEAGLVVGREDARAVISDVVIRDGMSRVSDGKIGRAITVQHDADVQLSRAIIERSRDVSVLAIGGATVTVQDVAVIDTASQRCSADTCADTPLGYGLGAVDGTLTASRFVVRGSELCGVFVARGGDLDLAAGEVTGGPIGACVQVDEYDFDRLTSDVVYRDNELNLETTMLPVPGFAAETTMEPP